MIFKRDEKFVMNKKKEKVSELLAVSVSDCYDKVEPLDQVELIGKFQLFVWQRLRRMFDVRGVLGRR